ncbi:MAG: ABC transporter substrate-binding protein, partial [Halanaerobiaceae bacterium]
WQNEDMPVLGEWKPVEIDPGERFVLERNPYYFGVDPEGNQLPYIDRVEIEMVSDNEIFKLKASQGESDMQIRPAVLDVPDISMLKNNEKEYNFETLTWNSGTGTEPVYYPNQNHPDPAKKELYQNSKFLKALSHSINREQINKMVYYNTGEITTGTFSPQCIEYQETEKGQEIYKEWRDSAKEYDPEKSESFLDELGVVDQNGDGWRQLPNGDELELRIDMDAEAATKFIDSAELVKEYWEDIGLKTLVNTMDGSQLVQMNQEGEIDIRDSWGVGNPHSHLMNGRWLVPFDSERWAPLYGNWEKVKGTDKEGTELDKEPRDRTPPREEPAEGSPYARLQELRNEAMVTPEDDAREELVFDMIKIHIEEGPFFFGAVADYPRIGVVSDRMKNVPRQEDLPLGGYVGPWFSYENGTNPMQFYIQE